MALGAPLGPRHLRAVTSCHLRAGSLWLVKFNKPTPTRHHRHHRALARLGERWAPASPEGRGMGQTPGCRISLWRESHFRAFRSRG